MQVPRKIGPFPDYHDAYDAAVDDARRYKCDIGIEKLNGEFRVFMLPKPKNRCGFELRCEVVTPDSPRVTHIPLGGS